MLSFGIMKAFYRYVSNSSGQLGSQLHRLIALQFHFPLLSRIPLCWKYPKESLKEDVEGIRTYNLAFCSSFNNCTFSGVVAVTSFYRRVVMYELYMDLLAVSLEYKLLPSIVEKFHFHLSVVLSS